MRKPLALPFGFRLWPGRLEIEPDTELQLARV
jgi:hypothetical protein